MKRQFFAWLIAALPVLAHAQAPATGPLILLVPASTRAVGVGNAWVAGRDNDAQFYNPAQMLAGRTEYGLTLARYSSNAALGSAAGTYAAGPWSLTLGWGVEYLRFRMQPGDSYPLAVSDLARDVTGEDAMSMLGTVGAAIVWKGFRIGLAGKYVDERVPLVTDVAGTIPTSHEAILGDIGVARNMLNGTVGLAIQNLGKERTGDLLTAKIPRQALLGYSMGRPLGQLDLAVAAQATAREDWFAPGGGVEIGYGWIEGYSVQGRIGARRAETDAEKPIALGATLNADHLTLEYALQFFDGGRTVNRISFRWR